ncbi:MAG TPA: dihydropteroate synthase [Tepidisphaeraceae bacterium]
MSALTPVRLVIFPCRMTPPDFERWLLDPLRRPLVMGVLNVTPDSFSDGGQYCDPGRAADHARRMAAEGADLIDVGGESTRPGAARVGIDEQIARVVPVIERLRGDGLTISIDTTRAAVAAAALDAGASIANDVSAGEDDPAMLPLAAARGCPVVLMHMRGQPADMQIDPVYDDVVADVAAYLQTRRGAAVAAGVAPHRVVLDPGIGFGKTVAHNLALLSHVHRLTAESPLLIGTSRKSFLAKAAGLAPDADRTLVTAASVAIAGALGAAIHRVHDVAAMRQVVDFAAAVRGAARRDA